MKNSLKIFIFTLTLTVAAAGFVLQSKQNPPKSVLGVRDAIDNSKVKTIENNLPFAQIPEPSFKLNIQKQEVSQEPKNETIKTESKKINPEIYLGGDGCEAAGNTCTLIYKETQLTTLKDCLKDNDNCNFYNFKLGKREQGIQFILRSYAEKSDKLLDIVEVNLDQKTTKILATKIFQDKLDLNQNEKNMNKEYTETLEKYSN
jgi:hypothetical protein